MRPVMPLVVGGWLDVLLCGVEEVEEEEEEEEMLIGVDIVDTGVDSAVVDNVGEVDAGVDVLGMELDEDATKVDVVDMRGVGDSTVDPGVLL